MIYAIGRPGDHARLLETDLPSSAQAQRQPGEVVFEVPSLTRGRIVAQGRGYAVQPVEADPTEAMSRVRDQRTARLAASDWTQLADAPLSEAQRKAWAAYRTALRNIPDDQPAATPDTIAWPQQPAGDPL